MEEIVAELQNVDSSKHQFISSVCIACFTEECHVSFKAADLYPLLKMLCVQPNLESKICPNVSYLMDVTEKSFR